MTASRGRRGFTAGGEVALVVGISVIVMALVAHRVIASQGVIILAENFEVYDLNHLLENYSPYWQERFQYFDFGMADCVYLYGLFGYLGKILALSYGVVQRLLLVLPHGLAFACMFLLVRYVLSTTGRAPGRGTASLLAAAAALVYTFNPWIASEPRDIALRWNYSLMPLVLYLLIHAFDTRRSRIRDIMLASLVLAFTACFRSMILTVPVLMLYALLPGDGNSEHPPLRTRLALMSLFLGSLAALTAGKFLSPVLYAVHAPQVPYAASFHEAMIGSASVLEVLSGKVLNSPARQALDATYADGSHHVFAIIWVISWIYLFMRSRLPGKKELFFPLLIILTLPVACLSAAPFGGFNHWLLTEAPLSSLYGRLLRFADWNTLPIVVALPPMLGLTLKSLVSRRPRNRRGWLLPVLCLGVSGLSAVSSWPMFTGDMNGYWSPSRVPAEFGAINHRLQEDTGESLAMWFPTYWEQRAVWAGNSGLYGTTAPTCNFDIRSSARPGYLAEQFYFFDYYNPMGPRPGFHPLAGYAGGDFSNLFADLNIGHIVFHSDIDWRSTSLVDSGTVRGTGRAESLFVSSPGGAQVVADTGWLRLVRPAACSPQVRATYPIVGFGGLMLHAALRHGGVTFDQRSLVYAESSHLSPEALDALARLSPGVIIQGDRHPQLSLLAAMTPPEELITPYRHTSHSDPLSGWSMARVQGGVADPRFQEALSAMDIDVWSWDFDFGDGIIFTIAPGADITVPCRAPHDGLYVVLSRYLLCSKGGALSFSVDGHEVTVPTMGAANGFRWHLLSTVPLDRGRHELTIRNIDGLNAVNVVALIPGKQFAGRRRQVASLLSNVSTVHVLEAELDLTTALSANRREEPVTASNGRALRLHPDDTARYEVACAKHTDYRLLTRCQGTAAVSVDSQGFDLHSDTWATLSSPVLHLDSGWHKITVVAPDTLGLDVLWLAEADAGEDVAGWFAVPDLPARIVACEKRGRAETVVTVDSCTRMLLTVADGYDPLIEARVGESSARSIPVFGTINGFLIDTSGRVDIDVCRVPQVWAEKGLVISMSYALLLVVGLAGAGIYRRRRNTLPILENIRNDEQPVTVPGGPDGRSDDNVTLTAIIPAYQEAGTIDDTLRHLRHLLDNQDFRSEIIVADDGSTDQTDRVVRSAAQSLSGIRLLRIGRNAGRGFALAEAIKMARGKVICYIDADLQIDPEVIPRFVLAIQAGADIAIGSKHHGQSYQRIRGWRRAQSICYNRLARGLLRLDLQDFQCGAKAFRRDVILPLLGFLSCRRWSWDTELLVKAATLGYTITELPVIAVPNKRRKSTVRLRDIIMMSWHLLRLWWWRVFRAHAFIQTRRLKDSAT